MQTPEVAVPAVVIRPVPVDDAVLHTHVLVAELASQVIGHGLMRLIRTKKRRIGRIGLQVDEGFRARGIDRTLLEQLLMVAGQQRVDRLEVEVLTTNAPAIELYEGAGFVTERLDQARGVCLMSRARQP